MAAALRLALTLVPAAWGQLLFLPSLRLGAEAEALLAQVQVPPKLAFEVQYAERLGARLTGRLRLHISTTETDEPSELLFGKDVSAWQAGQPVTLAEGDAEVAGFPAADLGALKGSRLLYVQAELVVYEEFRREGLPPTWLPTSCVSKAGANGQYAKPDGTLLSGVVQVDLKAQGPVRITLDRMVPDSTPGSPGCAGLGDGVDSRWVRTVRINSSLLERFWGRPMQLEACVLLPWGFEEHPDARYPLVLAHGHYSPQWEAGGSFLETPPSCDPSASYDCTTQHYAHYLYGNWTDPNGPFHGARTLVVTLNHPTPFFDDSYAVNTENMGPYGDAIIRELLPEVEARFRGIGEGWARGLVGGSTGGWETFAQQVFYPTEFNGAYAACPDPLTFTSYVSANIYQSANYFFYDSPWLRRPRPATRDHYSGTAFSEGIGPTFVDAYGEITQTLEEANHMENAQGTHSRSCGQWDVWEATFSPACPDGYPCRMYDKLTGVINHTVAEYWREHFDFAHILERDWQSLAPLLKGKLHLAVGGSDTFYLTNSVLDLRKVLERLGSDAEVIIGAHEGLGYQHCFNGYMYGPDGKSLPNSLTRLHYVQNFVPKLAQHFAATAPAGADTTSWRY